MLSSNLLRAATLAFCVFLLPQCDANIAAMSIDLGSQFIKIGLVKPGVPMEVILNKESRRKTPNILGLRNGERSFGDVAAQTSVKFPANALTFSLDLIGKQFDSPIVDKYRADFPHLNLTAHPDRNTVVFNIDNRSFDIETVLAMLLWNVRDQTHAFAEQDVKDVVIAVPAYFNEDEQLGVSTAAKIAGLNVLTLISEGAATALNYGVFRRKDITDTAQTLLIYDVGAVSTSATLVEYRLLSESETNVTVEGGTPSVRVLGYGYHRATGGKDLTDRLRDHLVAEFRAKHKTKADITTNPRAMAKLWKEAERVKQVLSANSDHAAQVESLYEDIDFKAKVSRDLIDEFVKDQWQHLSQPLKDALAAADVQAEAVEAVVLMGAGTRVPAVQQILKDFFKGKEISRSLNTDEAIALGSVYVAARLSKGFKVKPFNVTDVLATVASPSPPAAAVVNVTEEEEGANATDADATAASASTNATANTTADGSSSNSGKKLATAQITAAMRVLAEFERAERSRRDRERALNDLESLVFDTGVRLDEDAAFKDTQFKDELATIGKIVGELKTWLDDDSHTANTTTLRAKHTSLVRAILDKQMKERKVVEEAARKVREAKKEAERLIKEAAAAAAAKAAEAAGINVNETAETTNATDEDAATPESSATTTDAPKATTTDESTNTSADAERPEKEL